MSMNATDSACNAPARLRATVDFPDPEPPATPTMKGFIASPRLGRTTEKLPALASQKKLLHCHNLISADDAPLAFSNAKSKAKNRVGRYCRRQHVVQPA